MNDWSPSGQSGEFLLHEQQGGESKIEVRELREEATVAKFATVREEGDGRISRHLEYYNLDAVISVGYRVNSLRGTQFRTRATQQELI